MKLELGSPVRCTDGPFGELADVVIDPIARRVTHLVVAPHHQHGQARLVPIDLAAPANNGNAAVSLRCTLEHARQLPSVEEFAYLRLGELPTNDPDWDVGIENVLALPYYGYAGLGEPTMDYDPHVSMTYDRVPKGEVEIRARARYCRPTAIAWDTSMGSSSLATTRSRTSCSSAATSGDDAT